jgi:hypothetical protein
MGSLGDGRGGDIGIFGGGERRVCVANEGRVDLLGGEGWFEGMLMRLELRRDWIDHCLSGRPKDGLGCVSHRGFFNEDNRRKSVNLKLPSPSHTRSPTPCYLYLVLPEQESPPPPSSSTGMVFGVPIEHIPIEPTCYFKLLTIGRILGFDYREFVSDPMK